MKIIPTAQECRAARLAGAAYLFALPLSFFAEFYVMGRIVSPHGAGMTASNLAANQQLFRLGTASNFAVFLADCILIASLYLVLRQINRLVATIALVVRIMETALLFVAILFDMQAIKLLDNTTYMSGSDQQTLALLARWSLSGHGAAYNFALVLAGTGSTLFCYLWWKSGYIPKPLAALGMVASLILAVSTFAAIPLANAQTLLGPTLYGGPIGIYELLMGGWLLIRGIQHQART